MKLTCTEVAMVQVADGEGGTAPSFSINLKDEAGAMVRMTGPAGSIAAQIAAARMMATDAAGAVIEIAVAQAEG